MEIEGARSCFIPIRLALAGRAGEGELARVILLLDEGGGAFVAVTVNRRVRGLSSFVRRWIDCCSRR